ncbi:hypothetical protein NDU88_004247 [Pleurodeles waltl]|uniref:Uncharacterized protein n=1 Tax=Pleurodeles waltl TaxID=8319 RepID=A0AAV7MWN2_PLEWA|nr:hypothetical protein NDU88_004247 [Pleurodeles waltl]
MQSSEASAHGQRLHAQTTGAGAEKLSLIIRHTQAASGRGLSPAGSIAERAVARHPLSQQYRRRRRGVCQRPQRALSPAPKQTPALSSRKAEHRDSWQMPLHNSGITGAISTFTLANLARSFISDTHG